jgi:hypothetical protein
MELSGAGINALIQLSYGDPCVGAPPTKEHHHAPVFLPRPAIRRVLAAAMRDIKADWKRWSRAERISATAIVATSAIFYGFSLLADDLLGDVQSFDPQRHRLRNAAAAQVAAVEVGRRVPSALTRTFADETRQDTART